MKSENVFERRALLEQKLNNINDKIQFNKVVEKCSKMFGILLTAVSLIAGGFLGTAKLNENEAKLIALNELKSSFVNVLKENQDYKKMENAVVSAYSEAYAKNDGKYNLASDANYFLANSDILKAICLSEDKDTVLALHSVEKEIDEVEGDFSHLYYYGGGVLIGTLSIMGSYLLNRASGSKIAELKDCQVETEGLLLECEDDIQIIGEVSDFCLRMIDSNGKILNDDCRGNEQSC